ncbi:MAG TPA: sensor histidine kinase [Candidatus Acidoferrales bacterium]|nr:sensor histidine kinase [Candidatus Acidoferrales bacterium]
MLTAWIKRFEALPPIVTDGALALLLMVSADVAAYQDAGKLTALQVVVIALITLPVATRRLFPATVTTVIGAALIINLLLGFTNSFIENFAVLVALYTLYASVGAEWRVVAVSGLLVIGLITGVTLGWRNEGRVYLADIGYNAIIFALPVILGYGVRTRRAYVGQLHEQSRLRAREAAAGERTAIARELHDVIAHSVSVMVLQAAAGGRIARRDPAGAAATFEVIEQTGRDALADMRRVVGVLKDDRAEDMALSPQPSLGQLDALVEQVRQAGVNVHVRVDGAQRPLAPGVELSAYRIVQESLTNVLRHSGASDAEVAIRYGGNDLTVEVTDNGHNGATQKGEGNGLTGMRERVALLNGDFAAGDTTQGFRVSARLPLEAPTG